MSKYQDAGNIPSAIGRMSACFDKPEYSKKRFRPILVMMLRVFSMPAYVHSPRCLIKHQNASIQAGNNLS